MKTKWKKIIGIAGIWCLFLSLFAGIPVFAADNSESTTFDVRVVHTNDIHARIEEDDYNQVIGMDRLRGIINSFTEGSDGSLVLDSGDTFHGQSIATLVRGESVAKLLKACGYDAMTPGNHDWSYGKDRLKELGEIADVNILAGNIVNEDGTPFFEQDTFVKEITKDGQTLKIGVFGVSDPQMQQKTTPSNVAGLVFQDSVAYARQAAAKLKEEGCDVVIALSHTLNPQQLAGQVDNVDVWLCGHEHMVLDAEVTRPDGGTAYVVESGYYLGTAGLLKLEVTKNENGETQLACERTSVNYEQSLAYPKDSSVTAVLQEIKTENEAELNRQIGTSPVELDGVWEHLRIGQTNLGNVVTDAYLLTTGADVALENAGGIRASVKQGTITYGDVINVSPYGNYIVTKQLSGAQIREMLEISLEIQKNCIAANESGDWDAWPNDSGSYLQVGGIVVTYDPQKSAGQRVISVKKDGEELNAEKLYTVAMNNYLAESETYPQLVAAAEQGEYSSCDEALIRFFEQGENEIEASATKQCMVQYKEEAKDPDPGTQDPKKDPIPDPGAEGEKTKGTTPQNTTSKNTGKNDAQGQKNKAAKTADDTQMAFWMILMAGSCVTVAMAEGYRKRKSTLK